MRQRVPTQRTRRCIPMLRSIALATLVLSSVWAFADPSPVVDCGRGRWLHTPLSKMQKFEPATLKFKGTCTEFVVIDGFDNLTLTALPGATIQQPTHTPPV